MGIIEEKKEALGKVVKTAQFLGGLGEHRVGESWGRAKQDGNEADEERRPDLDHLYKDRLNLSLCLVRE